LRLLVAAAARAPMVYCATLCRLAVAENALERLNTVALSRRRCPTNGAMI